MSNITSIKESLNVLTKFLKKFKKIQIALDTNQYLWVFY